MGGEETSEYDTLLNAPGVGGEETSKYDTLLKELSKDRVG